MMHAPAGAAKGSRNRAAGKAYMIADLSGRAALITGAASGIGRASAVAFASAGASVALVDVDADGLADTAAAARSIGSRAEVLVADVRDLRAVTAAVGRAVEV